VRERTCRRTNVNEALVRLLSESIDLCARRRDVALLLLFDPVGVAAENVHTRVLELYAMSGARVGISESVRQSIVASINTSTPDPNPNATRSRNEWI